jgi:RNA polymerase sigma-70 factor (ECF subfamily)
MVPDSPETQALLQEARQGRADAVDRLMAEHREPLRQRISKRLDPALAARLDASDVVQEVMLEASERLREYLQNPSMPFALWLNLIADDHMIDAHRRHRLAKKRSLDRERPMHPAMPADRSSVELIAQLVDPEHTPASAAMWHELEARVNAAIENLDEPDREVIRLKHVKQLSNQDIARSLGLSEAAASMRYIRALRRLKAALAP